MVKFINFTIHLCTCILSGHCQIWMCGGVLETVPCSHVGHIFRMKTPYSWGSGKDILKQNSIRLAEVWLDDYKRYYYSRFNFVLVRSNKYNLPNEIYFSYFSGHPISLHYLKGSLNHSLHKCWQWWYKVLH